MLGIGMLIQRTINRIRDTLFGNLHTEDDENLLLEDGAFILLED